MNHSFSADGRGISKEGVLIHCLVEVFIKSPSSVAYVRGITHKGLSSSGVVSELNRNLFYKNRKTVHVFVMT
jgi:hypothetical protein